MSIMANTSEVAQLRDEAEERSAFFESAPAGLVIALSLIHI